MGLGLRARRTAFRLGFFAVLDLVSLEIVTSCVTLTDFPAGDLSLKR